MQCWRVSLDVTKPAHKLAVVTMFSVIPTTQTKQSPRPEDVGRFGGTKPGAPAVCLATQHLSFYLKDGRPQWGCSWLFPLLGKITGVGAASLHSSVPKVRPQWETGRAVVVVVRKSEGAGWWVWCLWNRAETQESSRIQVDGTKEWLVGRKEDTVIDKTWLTMPN